MRIKDAIRVASAFVILSCLTLSTAGQTPPTLGVRPIGTGSYPLSFTVASAWFAHKADNTEKLVTVLLYFQGNPGWLNEQTNFNFQVNQSPATIDMAVGAVSIHAKYWQQTDEVEVQGERFKRLHDNVFLVSVTDSAAPRIHPLGFHDLSFAPEDIPAMALLKRDPAVWSAVTGHPAGDHPLSQPSTAPPEVSAFDKEGLRLLLSGNPDEEKKGCELFRRAAERGYAPSQYRLGYCYESGEGVEQSFTLANQWYERAGNQGYVDAQYKLGHSYRTGRGVKIDLPTALSWYKKAAQSGDGDALQNVGWMYATGQGTEVDQPEAFKWLFKAALHGEAGAQLEVARRLKDGDGVEKDPSSAESWLVVLIAQRASFSADDWSQVETVITAVEKELDAAGRNRANERSKEWMRLISDSEMLSYARQ